MSEKIVSQLDAQGYFMGPVVADESPLEPGVFLLPGGAIDVEPPAVQDGKVALWQGEAWAYVNPPSNTQPEEPPIQGVPVVVDMAQARLALLQVGLLAQVDSAIEALEEPTRSAARIEWEYRTTVRRDSPLTQLLAEGLELTETQLDELFTIAAGL